jgi:hypothetical protein
VVFFFFKLLTASADMKETQKESAKLQAPAQVTGVEEGARTRKAPERFDPLAYDGGGFFLHRISCLNILL